MDPDNRPDAPWSGLPDRSPAARDDGAAADLAQFEGRIRSLLDEASSREPSAERRAPATTAPAGRSMDRRRWLLPAVVTTGTIVLLALVFLVRPVPNSPVAPATVERPAPDSTAAGPVAPPAVSPVESVPTPEPGAPGAAVVAPAPGATASGSTTPELTEPRSAPSAPSGAAREEKRATPRPPVVDRRPPPTSAAQRPPQPPRTAAPVTSVADDESLPPRVSAPAGRGEPGALADAAIPSSPTVTSPAVPPTVPRSSVESTAAPPVAAANIPTERQRIVGLLDTYREAYNSLDAASVSAIWAGVDTAALTRAFRSLVSQDVQFESCDIRTEGQSATALCRGQIRYVPKVGGRQERRQAMTWDIRLQRIDQRWAIVAVNAR